jgi:hypothetical protein
MRADYARNYEETLATSLQIVSFFKTFEELKVTSDCLIHNRGRGGGEGG